MNVIVAAVAGGVLAAVAAVGLVSAYNGDPAAKTPDQLVSYSAD